MTSKIRMFIMNRNIQVSLKYNNSIKKHLNHSNLLLPKLRWSTFGIYFEPARTLQKWVPFSQSTASPCPLSIRSTLFEIYIMGKCTQGQAQSLHHFFTHLSYHSILWHCFFLFLLSCCINLVANILGQMKYRSDGLLLRVKVNFANAILPQLKFPYALALTLLYLKLPNFERHLNGCN